MAKSNIIKVLVDGDAKGLETSLHKAKTALDGFKAKVSDAQGVGGKFKAGMSAIGDTLKENVAAAAVAAGTAILAFGIKAAGVFTDTATTARELGDAIGTSTEDASRWIAVADDMEVSADQLTTGLGKIAKSLDSGKWEEYGVATRDAGGNARKTNDIMLDSFDMLGKITNETQRAKVGNELFGKGYSNLAPLIGKSRSEYEKMLGAVEKGQVITERESEKAERLRLAQDALADATQEVTLAVGEMVANVAPAIEVLAKMAGAVTAVQDASEDLAYDLAGLNDGPVAGIAQGFGIATAKVKEMAGAADNMSGPLAAARDLMDQYGRRAKEAGEKTDKVKASVDAMDSALQKLKGHLSERDAWDTMTDALGDLMTTMADGEASWEDLSRSSDNATEAVANYIEQTDKIKPEVKTYLYQELDKGNLDYVTTVLANLEKGIKVPLFLETVGKFDLRGARAAGGPVEAGGSYLVGERGPEVVTMGSNGHVTPNDKIGGLGGGVTNITMIGWGTKSQLYPTLQMIGKQADMARRAGSRPG